MKNKKLDFDWSCLPAWANWIAMDKNETWSYYVIKPVRDNYASMWNIPHRDNWAPIPPKYAPKNFTGKWTESLFKRHKK